MEKITLHIDEIHLDPNNPRYDEITEESKIIEYMVRNEKIIKLAGDIASNGLSPLDTIMVVNENDEYIVIEGNRRICALKLLNNPNLAPKEQINNFNKITNELIFNLSVILTKDRNEAKKWLIRKHTGEQGGIGILPWSADQKSKFDENSNNTLALELLSYMQKINLISKEARSRKLTTCKRFLGDPAFRNFLGITSKVRDTEIKLNLEQDVFEEKLKIFADTLVNNKFQGSILSRFNKQLRQSYINHINAHHPELVSSNRVDEYVLQINTNPGTTNPGTANPGTANPGTANPGTANPGTANPGTANPGTANPGTANPIKNNPSPNDRKYLIPSSFKVKIQNKVTKRIYDELNKLDSKQYPFSAILLVRVFLENVYLQYYKIILKRTTNKDKKMHNVLCEICGYIERNDSVVKGDSKLSASLKGLKLIKDNPSNIFAFETLGAFHHGKINPDIQSAKAQWDNIELIIQYMIKKSNL